VLIEEHVPHWIRVGVEGARVVVGEVED